MHKRIMWVNKMDNQLINLVNMLNNQEGSDTSNFNDINNLITQIKSIVDLAFLSENKNLGEEEECDGEECDDECDDECDGCEECEDNGNDGGNSFYFNNYHPLIQQFVRPQVQQEVKQTKSVDLPSHMKRLYQASSSGQCNHSETLRLPVLPASLPIQPPPQGQQRPQVKVIPIVDYRGEKHFSPSNASGLFPSLENKNNEDLSFVASLRRSTLEAKKLEEKRRELERVELERKEQQRKEEQRKEEQRQKKVAECIVKVKGMLKDAAQKGSEGVVINLNEEETVLTSVVEYFKKIGLKVGRVGTAISCNWL
ncbi:Hypothetical protein ORPV_3 [Orpheovirus IHUMI-LCC2]|uniref:Uncharacterized protein n=1 Tax=Orpheovirus IHUMI-LCC2 TaxID=2023057 RepID=A0A2I2L317_9VIRU|nr:Hypothetical protein ORPV_3 [Orpheovirus IHUMI-LCC2]SNW61907.1 Hypothetical protein ORPV_3 [Orpheovirus IHUMI-LCC2]